MPSSDLASVAAFRADLRPLVCKELCSLLLSRALWSALLIATLLTGYSYVQAISLYSAASRTAARSPEFARGLSPLDGIVVPTCGALYLASTFLLPFIAIRSIGMEKQSGSLKLLLQLPYTVSALITVKAAMAVAAWAILLLPCLLSLALWCFAGGHLAGLETANVILGHFLYAIVVIGVSLLAAVVADAAATAAIGTLAVTLGFWVLDFAAVGKEGTLKDLAALSMTNVLRSFEHGIFSGAAVVCSLAGAISLLIMAGVWLHPGRAVVSRWTMSVLVGVAATLVIGLAGASQYYRDATEDRRNSFSSADEAALRALPERLTIEVHLAAEDPRLYDLERSVLGKLRRTVPDVGILYCGDTPTQRDPIEQIDDYGQVVYKYAGREIKNPTTNEGQVLSLLFELVQCQRPPAKPAKDYPGYPLVTGTTIAEVTFYLVVPFLCFAGYWLFRNHLRSLSCVGRQTSCLSERWKR